MKMQDLEFKDDDIRLGDEINEAMEESEKIEEFSELDPPENYLFETDELGRTRSASGNLVLENANRNLYLQKNAGGEFRCDDDQGGHLIGTRFNGPPIKENLVAENAKVNQRDFKALEKEWADHLEHGSDVYAKIEPIYSDTSERPYAITGEYDVTNDEGEKFKDYFSFTNEDMASEEMELPEDSELFDELEMAESSVPEEYKDVMDEKISLNDITDIVYVEKDDIPEAEAPDADSDISKDIQGEIEAEQISSD